MFGLFFRVYNIDYIKMKKSNYITKGWNIGNKEQIQLLMVMMMMVVVVVMMSKMINENPKHFWDTEIERERKERVRTNWSYKLKLTCSIR